MSEPIYSTLLHKALKTFAPLDCFHIKRNGAYQSWTYGDVHKEINILTDALKKSGFSTNQKALLIGPNTPEWVIVYHSVIQAGGQIVPLDPNLSSEEIGNICRVTEPTMVFCSEEYYNTFLSLKEESQSISEIILLTDSESDISYYTFKASGSESINAFERPITADEEVAILFTSGTTGTPKGVVLQQRNLHSIGNEIAALLQITPGTPEKVLAVLPLYHVFGFAACIVATVTNGMQAVFVPELKGNLILEALNEKEVTILPAIPQLLTIFYKNIQSKVQNSGVVGRSLFKVLGFLSATVGKVSGTPLRAKIYSRVHKGFGGKLRIIVSGGASLDKETFYGFTNMGFNILEGYGLTETFGPISLCPIWNPKQGTVGPVIAGNEVKIDAPSGEAGEILLRGNCVFPGYFNNKAATEEVIDADGWFHSGDIGYLDSDGYIVISGRKKELIVLESGKNLFPDELEEFYLKESYIEELSIFGLKEGNAEKAVALIVPSAELRSKYDASDITTLFQEKFHELHKGKSSYKIFSDFAITNHPLPRTSTRKAIKRECRAIYEEIKSNGAHHTVAKLSVKEENLMKSDLFTLLAKEVATQTGTSIPLTPRSTFGVDIAIDSLTFAALVASLEQQLGYHLPQETLANCDTLGDLYTAIDAVEPEDSDKNKSTDEISVHFTNIFERVGNSLLALFARTISTLFWSLKVRGKENLTPTTPTIFVANHQSNLDPGWILTQLPGNIRKKTFTLGKYELVKIPIVSAVFKMFNILPIDRYGKFSATIEKAEELVARGNSILLFPEGTRSIDGNMKEFKSGVGHIVAITNAQVIPIKIKGSYDVWPKGSSSPKLFTGRSISSKIEFGSPIPTKEYRDMTPETITEHLHSVLEGM